MGHSSALAFSPGAAGPLLGACDDLAWQDRALCAGSATPDDWFPVKGTPTARARRNVERTCGTCPVRAQCLAYALENDLRGTWGGLSERERRRTGRQAASAVPMLCAGGTHVRSSRNRGLFGNCTDCQEERAAARAGNGLAA